MTEAIRLLKQIGEGFDPSQFGMVEPAPTKYLHYSNSPQQVRAILQGGFSTRFFGQTSRKYKMSYDYDPVGIYAVNWDDGGYIDERRPWILFTLNPPGTVLRNPDAHHLKKDLKDALGFSGKRLTNLLLKSGIQVLESCMECIILDLSRIQILQTSEDNR